MTISVQVITSLTGIPSNNLAWYLVEEFKRGVERGVLSVERDKGVGDKGGVKVLRFECSGMELEAEMEVVEEWRAGG